MKNPFWILDFRRAIILFVIGILIIRCVTQFC